MVSEILPDRRKVVDGFDSQSGERRGIADAGMEQDVGRANGSSGEDDFLLGSQRERLA
jgi:hypothetical protein